MTRLRRSVLTACLALLALAIGFATAALHRHDQAQRFAAAHVHRTALGVEIPCPAPGEPRQPDEHACALCWTAAKLASAAVPVTPALTQPIWRAAPAHIAPVALVRLATRPANFQARAPPAKFV